ncbi:MAG: HAD-IA family hydrolase [Rhodobacteraceae bacterium]|nr:HAD-IA family hydrolase [Paracoccaceae bacterium]
MRSAIFDLDGTLADTAGDLIGAANALLSERGLTPLDPQTARNTAGRGGKALMSLGFERAGAPVTRPELEAMFPAYLDAYRARIDQETRLFEGVVDTLDALRSNGWLLGVCTNKPEALAIDLLKRLDVSDYFGAIVGADTLPVRKPDPRPVWETIERVGGLREKAVMIGDTQTDRDAARNAEIPVILVSFGYESGPISALRPDAAVSDFPEIAKALLKLS